SIVGPRPLPISDFEKLENGKVNYDWYTKRGNTKPGITGLWQISGRSDLSFEEMCLLDLYYIENQSIFFDMEIMFETIPVAFLGKGAY
ncbi:MAG: sugar transferase, partial [Calditrichaeota bacterium]|nr:sugar transferase [Calditrichota bacterium]